MRNGQNKHHRMRGRNRGGGGKNHNPLTRVYESNGPDVKIRGTANHVAEKYIQLARDATASGDPVAAENYYQHAEHYFRLIAAAQEQFRQSQPFQQQQPRQQDGNDENFDGDDDAQPSSGEPHYTPREQPYQQQRQHHNQQRHERNDQPRQERGHERAQQQQPGNNDGDVGGLPSFITGGQPQQSQPHFGQNGHEGQGDRFPLNRRRRRPRGPSQDAQSSGESADDSAPAETQPGE